MKLRTLAALAALALCALPARSADVSVRPPGKVLFSSSNPSGACGPTGDIFYQTSTHHAWACIGGTWYDVGPNSTGAMGGSTGSTDNRVLRSDGTGGATVQASAITVDDSGNVSGVGTLSGGAITSSALTSGRVPIAGTSGLLGDDADLTFATDTLTATKTSTGQVTITTTQGGSVVYGVASENLTLSGASTDTSANLLPALSVIDAVTYRVTTGITTAASFTIGDSGTAARFCSTQSTVTLGTTNVCMAHLSNANSGPLVAQVAAAKVRVTPNTSPGAGAIRIQVYYHTYTAPTS